MDKRKIIELDIDVDAIIAKSSQLKTDLDKSRESLNSMKKAGDTSSDTYIQLAAKVSKLSSEYNMNQKQLINLIAADDKFLSVNDKITLALDQENISISEARKNNSELLKIRNELNLADENQLQLANEINSKIDSNNDFIKSNVSEREKQVLGIGDYKTAIVGALEETGLFGGQLQNITQYTSHFNGIFAKMKTELSSSISLIKNAGAETEGMGKAQAASAIATNVGTGALRIFKLALAATGIGLLVIGVGLLINGLSKLDPVMDLIEQATAGIGGAIDKASAIVVKFVSGITSIGDAFSKIGNLIAHPIDSIKSFGKEVGDAAIAAAKLKEAEQELGDLKDIYDIRNKRIESEINLDKIRLKSKDLTAKEEIEIEKRINDNFQKLSDNKTEVNDKTLDLALKNAIQTQSGLTKLSDELLAHEIKNGELKYANYLLNEGKITKDAYDKLKEATNVAVDSKNQQAEAEERAQDKIEKAREKAEANAQKAADEARKRREEAEKVIDKEIEQSKKAIDLFIAQQGVRAKSLEDSLRLEEQIRDKKLAVNQKEFDAKRKTELDYQLETLNIKNDFLKKQSDIAIANAQNELRLFLDVNKSRLDANKFLTDELVAQELDRLNRVSEAEAAFQTERLNQGQINQEEYNTAIRDIDSRFEEEKKALEEEKALAEIDKRAIDLENKIAINQEDLDLQIQKLEQERLVEVKAAEKSGASIELINKKYAKSEADLRKSVELEKLTVIAETLGKAAGLFKENTLAYKALAIGEATINTFIGATRALKDYAYPLGGIVAGVTIATGLASVAKISGIKLAKGAVDLEGPGTGTSDSIPAMLSKGESVITAEATRNNKGLLAMMNANAGIDLSSQFLPPPIINMYSSQSTSQGMDYDLLAAKIGANVAEANKSLPAPKVAITDINYAQEDYAKITDGADLWP